MKKIFVFSIIMGLLSNIAAYSQKDDFYNTGVEKFNQKDFQGALQSFSKAIELDPVFTNALFERAKTSPAQRLQSRHLPFQNGSFARIRRCVPNQTRCCLSVPFYYL